MDKNTLVHQVEFVLNTEPETRNSDITLTIAIWKRYYTHLIDPQDKIYIKDLFELPREDNIKRIRSKIQNEERAYLPTDPAIFLERAKLSKEWREFLDYKVGKNPDTLTDFDFQNYILDTLKPKQQTLV